MNSPIDPFDAAPTSPPVSTDPPTAPPASSTPSGPRRGRMVAGALAAVGLLGAGVFGVSQLASADRPESPAATDESSEDDGDEATTEHDETTDEATDEAESDDGDELSGDDEHDGRIVIDLGGDEPLVLDLDDLNPAMLEQFGECVGLPEPGTRFEDGPWSGGTLDELLDGLEGSLDEWMRELGVDLELPDLSGGELALGPEGNQITVLGPDGVTVVDLGEGDASVTITQEDGEIAIAADGDATVEDLSDVFEHVEEFDIGELPNLEEIIPDDLFDRLPELDEFDLDLPDPEVVEDCLAELG